MRAVDSGTAKLVESLREFDAEQLAGVTFAAQSADNRTVPLVPGGEELPVTLERRDEYAGSLLRYKLHEFDAQVRDVGGGYETCDALCLCCARGAHRGVCARAGAD